MSASNFTVLVHAMSTTAWIYIPPSRGPFSYAANSRSEARDSSTHRMPQPENVGKSGNRKKTLFVIYTRTPDNGAETARNHSDRRGDTPTKRIESCFEGVEAERNCNRVKIVINLFGHSFFQAFDANYLLIIKSRDDHNAETTIYHQKRILSARFNVAMFPVK